MLQVPSGDSPMNNKLRGLTTLLLATIRIIHHTAFGRKMKLMEIFTTWEKGLEIFQQNLENKSISFFPGLLFFNIYSVAYIIEKTSEDTI